MNIVRKTGDYSLNNSFIPNSLPPSNPNLMLNSKLLTTESAKPLIFVLKNQPV